MNSRLIFPALAVGFSLLLSGPAAARDCQITATLGNRDKALPLKLYVSPDEKDFIESLGLTLTPGLFQGYGVKASDVYRWFDANGCDETLVNWVVTKARDKREKKDTVAPPPPPAPTRTATMPEAGEGLPDKRPIDFTDFQGQQPN